MRRRLVKREWAQPGDVARVRLSPGVPGEIVGLVVAERYDGLILTLAGDDVPFGRMELRADDVEPLRAPPHWLKVFLARNTAARQGCWDWYLQDTLGHLDEWLRGR